MTTIPNRRQRKHTNDRITIEALAFYAPLFKLGDEAEERILEGGLTVLARNRYETQARLKDLALNKIAALAGPLITSEIKKLIVTSHIAYSDDLFDLLYYAGLSGLGKGLRHFDEDKMKASATNYLFQWFVVYAKRELSILESPFGIAPSRFQKYKKISAVRKKLSSVLDRPATNDEVLAYFHSGQADLKTMNGKVGSSEKASQANRSMTLELVEEQESFEKNYMHTDLLDPLADYSTDVKLSKVDVEPFSQTVFGVFIEKYGVSDVAKAVLMSDLGSHQIDNEGSALVAGMDVQEYKAYSNAWKELIKDAKGPFYEFLKTVESETFEQFDIQSTIQNIEANTKVSSRRKYNLLFADEGKNK